MDHFDIIDKILYFITYYKDIQNLLLTSKFIRYATLNSIDFIEFDHNIIHKIPQFERLCLIHNGYFKVRNREEIIKLSKLYPKIKILPIIFDTTNAYSEYFLYYILFSLINIIHKDFSFDIKVKKLNIRYDKGRLVYDNEILSPYLPLSNNILTLESMFNKNFRTTELFKSLSNTNDINSLTFCFDINNKVDLHIYTFHNKSISKYNCSLYNSGGDIKPIKIRTIKNIVYDHIIEFDMFLNIKSAINIVNNCPNIKKIGIVLIKNYDKIELLKELNNKNLKSIVIYTDQYTFPLLQNDINYLAIKKNSIVKFVENISNNRKDSIDEWFLFR